MKQLIEDIAKALVDIPEEVSVREVAGEQVTVLELKVAPSDLGQGDRQARPHRAFHPHDSRSGRHEAESPLHAGNSRVSPAESAWVTVALLGRPGATGANLRPFPSAANRNVSRTCAKSVCSGPATRYEVEATWFHDGTLIFKFRGIDTISDAEKLIGAEVRVPLSERVAARSGRVLTRPISSAAKSSTAAPANRWAASWLAGRGRRGLPGGGRLAHPVRPLHLRRDRPGRAPHRGRIARRT